MYNKVECIILTCDNCQDHYESANGFSIFSFESDINPEDDDWYVDNDKHYCPQCHTVNDEDELIINTDRTKLDDQPDTTNLSQQGEQC